MVEVFEPDPWFWLSVPGGSSGSSQPPTRLRVFILHSPQESNAEFRKGTRAHALTPYAINTDNGLRVPYPVCQRTVLDDRVGPAYPPYDPMYESDPSLYNRLYDYVYSEPGIDYVQPNIPNTAPYYEIGNQRLRFLCEQAELADRDFAAEMQGTLGVAASYTWNCLQTDFNPADRHNLLQLFIMGKLDMSLAGMQAVSQSNEGIDTMDIAHELIRQHRAFTQQWVRQHFHTLTPAITSHAEALVTMCHKCIPQSLLWLPRISVARALWRCEQTRGAFQDALFWHITCSEQHRGGRNPSYKQMHNVSNENAQSYYRLVRRLQSMDEMTWQRMLGGIYNRTDVLMKVNTIDWHSIAAQIPSVHRKYTVVDTLQAMSNHVAQNQMQNIGKKRWRRAPGRV
jgi:hypothetical protein